MGRWPDDVDACGLEGNADGDLVGEGEEGEG